MRYKINSTNSHHLTRALFYSFHGLRYVWRHEYAFRLEVYGFCIALPLALWLGGTPIEKLMLIISYGGVLIVELLNTAIEVVVDRIDTDEHALSKAAKDVGSAAVFLSLVAMATVWLTITVPYILQWVRSQ